MKKKNLLSSISVLLLSVLFVGNAHAGEWEKRESIWMYKLDNESYAKNGWQFIGGCWYNFDENGYMKIGWMQDSDGTWYYLNSDGAMVSNAWVDGKYYVGSDGAMLTNTTTPDGYFVDVNGEWDGKPANYNSKEKKHYTIEEAQNMALSYYNSLHPSTNGDYVIFDDETGIRNGNYEFIIRWQMSPEEAERRMSEGRTVLPNLYESTVYFNIQTGEMKAEWRP